MNVLVKYLKNTIFFKYLPMYTSKEKSYTFVLKMIPYGVKWFSNPLHHVFKLEKM